MPRINVEDAFWKDDRFHLLVEKIGKIRASGACLIAMKIAQGFWVQDKLIPEEIWKLNDLPPSLFAVGLVELCAEGKTLDDGRVMAPGVYVRGSEKQFAWLVSRKLNGSKGGKKTKTVKTSSSEDLVLANASERKREQASLLSSPFSKTNTKTCSTSGRTGCQFDLEAAYQKYPRKQGKGAGMKTLTKQIKQETDYWDLLTAIENYSRSETVNKGFVKLFSTFANEWREWLDPQTGKITTGKSAVQKQFELNSASDVKAVGSLNPFQEKSL